VPLSEDSDGVTTWRECQLIESHTMPFLQELFWRKE